MNEGLENILSRNSPRELSEPIPSSEEMELVYKAALRAPDHAWQRPSRFIEITGRGLEKLSKIFKVFNSFKIWINLQERINQVWS